MSLRRSGITRERILAGFAALVASESLAACAPSMPANFGRERPIIERSEPPKSGQVVRSKSRTEYNTGLVEEEESWYLMGPAGLVDKHYQWSKNLMEGTERTEYFDGYRRSALRIYEGQSDIPPKVKYAYYGFYSEEEVKDLITNQGYVKVREERVGDQWASRLEAVTPMSPLNQSAYDAGIRYSVQVIFIDKKGFTLGNEMHAIYEGSSDRHMLVRNMVTKKEVFQPGAADMAVFEWPAKYDNEKPPLATVEA